MPSRRVRPLRARGIHFLRNVRGSRLIRVIHGIAGNVGMQALRRIKQIYKRRGMLLNAVEFKDEQRRETRQFGVLDQREPTVVQNEPMLIEANGDHRVILIYDSVMHDDQPEIGC